jgi:hypothetical protein
MEVNDTRKDYRNDVIRVRNERVHIASAMKLDHYSIPMPRPARQKRLWNSGSAVRPGEGEHHGICAQHGSIERAPDGKNVSFCLRGKRTSLVFKS